MKEELPVKSDKNILPDAWVSLRDYTAARIALGRTGTSIPVKQTLAFQLDHAHARDAVYSELNKEHLLHELDQLRVPVCIVHSKASTREEYLQRPDWGRQLDNPSSEKLSSLNKLSTDMAIILADGLSAEAINRHAIPVLQLLLPELQKSNFSVAPLILAEQGRVALSDEIGGLLQAKLAVIFIGERPGLSSPDSMGVYLTYNPKPGTTDEARNCISNIRPEGLSYQAASGKILYFIQECLRLKLSGVAVKDFDGLLR